jgi:hypothetical protein
MVLKYDTSQAQRRGAGIRRTIGLGTKVILGLVGLGLFRSEVVRIASLPKSLNNELYLVLLGVTALLTAGWILVANKEFDIMCNFLDPKDYEVPDENIVGLGIALILSALLFASRDALWFGACYSAYIALSLLAWWRARNEIGAAIEASRKRLLDETDPVPGFLFRALDLLDRYYVKRYQLTRLGISLALGLIGFGLSIFAVEWGERSLISGAYVLYIISIAAFEGGVAFYWRYVLYSGIKPLDAAKHEFDRTREHLQTP